jgi:uncharacterized membrane protein
MDRSSIILSFAIFALFVANISFTEFLYFSPLQLVAINLLGLVAAIAFFWAYSQKDRIIKLNKKINIHVVVVILLIFLVLSFQLVGIAVAISIAALYAASVLSKKYKSYKFYSIVAVVIILASAFSFVSVSGLRGTNWKGVDEVAFNYYASYLLIHGSNPYSTSMQPILTAHNITPTFLLNGSTETAYDYPALSFLPIIFLGFFNLQNFQSFIAIVIFLSILVAFVIYKSTNYNNAVLIPIAVWFIATYLYIGTIDQYIAVSLLLLLAYMERKNTIISSILLGLAASTIQLAWFAIPFFFILTLREKGKNTLIKSLLIVIAIFLIINSYFIAIGPIPFIHDMFLVFGTSKLLLYGTNITQVLMRSYGVTLWYPAVISIMVLLSLMLLFYLYTDTLRPLIAVAPAFIFFLSWRNLPMYALAFVPLMIWVCYAKEKKKVNDILKKRNYIAVIFAIIILVSFVLAVYAHALYERNNTLVINSAVPAIQKAGNGVYEFNGIAINVTNNANSYENVSLFLINRYPGKDDIFLSKSLAPIAPHSSKIYSLQYNVYNVTRDTNIYLIAFSKDYITNNEFNISIPENGTGG